MRSIILSGAGLALMLTASAVRADEAGRYALEKSGNSIVRLDRQTGEISTCEDRAGQLVCRLAADEKQAFEDDFDRLQAKVDRLEKRVAALETVKPGVAESLLPSDADVDRTLDIMERALRRFMGVVKQFDQNPGKDGSASPDKT